MLALKPSRLFITSKQVDHKLGRVSIVRLTLEGLHVVKKVLA